MLQSFKAKNFRQIDSVSVGGLKSFNLVTGLNGSGKTSLLEAIFLLSGTNNASLIIALSNWRGESAFNPEVDYPFRSIFRNLDPSNTIEIAAVDRHSGRKIKKSRVLGILPILGSSVQFTGSAEQRLVMGVKLSYRSNGLKQEATMEWKQTAPSGVPTGKELTTQPESTQSLIVPEQRPISEIITGPSGPQYQLVTTGQQSKDFIRGHFVAPRYQNPIQQTAAQLKQRVKGKSISDIIELMSGVEPRIKDLSPLSEHGRDVVYVDIGLPTLIPLTSLGSGFLNYLRIGLACLDSPGGIVLIDEIEDGIHHSLMKPLFQFLLTQAKQYKTQVFASTHSKEIVEAFYEVLQEIETQDVCALRLQRIDEVTRVQNYNYKDLLLASEMNVEIRG